MWCFNMKTMQIAKILAGVFVLWVLICIGLVIYFAIDFSSNGGSSGTEDIAPSCTISLNRDLTYPEPLVLNSETYYNNIHAFLLPTNGDTVELPKNESFTVACPNGTLVLGGTSTFVMAEPVECMPSGSFEIRGENLSFSEITCSRIPYHIARRTGYGCMSQSSEVEIGFLIHGRFISIMTACFGRSDQQTFYTEFTLTKTIGGSQSSYPTTDWLEGEVFYELPGTTIGALYNRVTQRATINKLLGLDESSFQVINNGNSYLAPGHLTAAADFLYRSQQSATYYYVNAAPQWQTFNEGNWNSLEQDIRGYASRMGFDLTVYTGTYGVASLPHATAGVDVDLYLFVDFATRKVPVPRLFWKIVYEPRSMRGVVFVGVNNPFSVDPSKDVLCIDICNNYKWLSWIASNITLGYSYCCDVREFARTVTNLPYVDVLDVLP